MDIDELQTVQSRERQTDSLQQLRDSFYAEASEFIDRLREARDDAAQRADDPWDNPEVNRLSDEIKTAEQTVEAIYDRRVGKVVKKASLAAADMPADEDGLTSEEQALFEQLVESIEDNRNHVLDMIAGDVEPSASPVSSPTDSGQEEVSPAADPGTGRSETTEPKRDESDAVDPPNARQEGVSAADVMNTDGGTRAQPPAEAPPSASEGDQTGSDAEPTGDQPTDSGEESERGVDRRTVKIKEDVGEILGVDERAYDLSENDVVSLPSENAEPLVQRDAAQPLD